MQGSSNKMYIDKFLLKELSTDPVFIKDDTYCNELFGISFLIPKNWFIVGFSEVNKAIEQQKFVGEYEYYKYEIAGFFDQPALMLTKFDPNSTKYHGLVSPTINFNIIPKEPDYEDFTLEEYAELLESQEGFGYDMLKEFRIKDKTNVFNRKGFDYIRYDTEYLFESREIEIGIMVELSIWNIDFGDFFLDFSMSDCIAQNQVAKEEFDRTIDSINLEC